MNIKPNWPAPSNVHAYTTLRKPYKHAPSHEELKQGILLPNEPLWLTQIHGTRAIDANIETLDKKADASFTNQSKQICVVLSADCLPLLLCDRKGTQVAAIHAGWRGLGGGIIENTVNAMQIASSELMVWLGPAITQPNYEVGDEVRALFLEHDLASAAGFIPSPQGRWLASLYQLARIRLANLGINAIYGGEFCTYSDPRFYSYRRDGAVMGNMASFIWIE